MEPEALADRLAEVKAGRVGKTVMELKAVSPSRNAGPHAGKDGGRDS